MFARKIFLVNSTINLHDPRLGGVADVEMVSKLCGRDLSYHIHPILVLSDIKTHERWTMEHLIFSLHD